MDGVVDKVPVTVPVSASKFEDGVNETVIGADVNTFEAQVNVTELPPVIPMPDTVMLSVLPFVHELTARDTSTAVAVEYDIETFVTGCEPVDKAKFRAGPS